MKNLNELRDLKQEVVDMKFDYKNVHRILYLVYKTKNLLEENNPIPNRDIALHQTNKVINQELMHLIKSDAEPEIKIAFNELIDNFKLVLAYIA